MFNHPQPTLFHSWNLRPPTTMYGCDRRVSAAVIAGGWAGIAGRSIEKGWSADAGWPADAGWAGTPDSPAVAVTSLYVEPGAYWEIALFSSGWFLSASSFWKAVSLMPSAKS